jgi:hypothetical protein
MLLPSGLRGVCRAVLPAELQAVVRTASVVSMVLMLVLVLAAALAVPLAALSATSASAATQEDPPLSIEITSVTPSALRPGSPLQIDGVVTNVDDQVWSELQAYLVISTNPLTSRSELAAAAESPPESYIGERLTEFGSFSRLGSLERGASAEFSLDVPWATLETIGTDGVYITGAEGVYTVGVQILATDESGIRDPVNAVARARTFVPLRQPAAQERPRRIAVGLLWPLREELLRRSNGTYVHADRLRASLAQGGRLRSMVDLAAQAGDVPVSLVADPALLDAAEALAAGRFGPPAATDEASGSGDTTDVVSGASPQAGDWLQDVAALWESAGWVTGYGEPDRLTVAEQATPRLRRAILRAGRLTTERVLDGDAPTLAFTEPERVGASTLVALAGAADDPVAVLSSERLREWDAGQGVALSVPTTVDDGDLPVLVADPALAAGGPAPGDRYSALQMRQRLLSETALLSMRGGTAGAGSPASALFVPPPDWNPGPFWNDSGFFAGLRTPWLRPTPVDTLLARSTRYSGGVAEAEPAPQSDSAALLDPELVDASASIARRTSTLSALVGGDPDLAAWYSAAAALGMSRYGHDDAARRLAVTQRAASALKRELGKVRLEGPSFVTLSSSRGRFGVSITNGLDRSITVGVRAKAFARGLQFQTGDPVTVGPGQRQTVFVDTRADGNQVARGQVVLVTKGGEQFGRQLDFSVRSSIVGVVIWVVVAVAGLLLLIAITRRVLTRIRSRSARHGAVAGT